MFWIMRGKNRRPEVIETRDQMILGFGGHQVHLQRQAYRRSISITLQVNGRIRVRAPKSTPVSRIEEFLLKHREWIEANVARYQSLRARHPRKRYVAGEKFPFLGGEVELSFVTSSAGRLRVELGEGRLAVAVPRSLEFDFSGEHAELADVIARRFSDVGRDVLEARVAEISEQMGLRPRSLSFRSQKTRWGSCSVNGGISLNWRLVVAPLEVIDYVVAHELAHLRHHNHSLAFWRLVAEQVPDYEARRRWLRENQFIADFLAKNSELYPD